MYPYAYSIAAKFQSAETPTWGLEPPDQPRAARRHSGRVGRWQYARNEAQIDLYNIRNAQDVPWKQQPSISGFCAPPRRQPHRAAAAEPRYPHPRTQRANHTEVPQNTRSRSLAILRWQDHAHRVRKGRISLSVEGRASP